MTDGNDTTNLADLIVNRVEEYWAQHEKPLLLSQLGSWRGGEIAKLTKEEAGSLGGYLKNKLSEQVRVIQHSSKLPVIGAIPAHVRISEKSSIDELLSGTQNLPTRPVHRFHSAVWTAFKKPLDNSKKRYLNYRDPLRFVDVTQEEKLEGFLEIERDSISEPTAGAKEIEEKIQSWIAEHDLELSIFVSKKRSSAEHLPSNGLLDKLLTSLDADDLRRMSMPLDIVYKLRREQL